MFSSAYAVPPVVFWLYCSGCPVLAVLSWPYIDIDARARNYERKNQGALKYERDILWRAEEEHKKSRSGKKERKKSWSAGAQNLKPKKERQSTRTISPSSAKGQARS
jgi:hypothetical protein